MPHHNTLSDDDVRKFIESKNLKWVSGKYLRSDSTLNLECEVGHSFSRKYCNLRKNYKCPECNKIKKGESKLEKYTKVKEEIESNGSVLMTEEKDYTNCDGKIFVLCRICKVKQFETSLIKFRNLQEKACGKCSGTVVTIDDIRELASSRGDVLLSNYKNSYTKFEIECGVCKKEYERKKHEENCEEEEENGEKPKYIHETTWNAYRKREDCLIQAPKKNGKKKGLPEEVVIKYISFFSKDSLVGNWENFSTYITIKCGEERDGKICGKEYSTTLTAFQQGRRCCMRYNVSTYAYSDIQFYGECHNEIVVSEEKDYKELSSHLKVECSNPDCRKIYKVRADYFLIGKRCKCRDVIVPKKKRETFDKRTFLTQKTLGLVLKEKGFTLLSKHYKTVLTKIVVSCDVCEYMFTTTYHQMKHKERCKLCFMNKKVKETRHPIKFVREQIEKGGDSWANEHYTNCGEKLDIRCKTCNEVYKMSLNDYCWGKRCPPCAVKRVADSLRNTFEYVTLVIEGSGDLLLSETYLNNSNPLEIFCGSCHKIYTKTFNEYSSAGARCPHCIKHMSKGEEAIKNYLEKTPVIFEFKKEKRFKDCKYKSHLRFDFYVKVNKSGEEIKKFLIEFNGSQHYRATNFFGGEEAFRLRQIRDKIKIDWCKEKNKHLLIIHYKDYKNISRILNEYIRDL